MRMQTGIISHKITRMKKISLRAGLKLIFSRPGSYYMLVTVLFIIQKLEAERTITIVEATAAAGVIGAGGAGFPTHVKLQAAVDTVIANGAECEPLLSTDRYLMETEPEAVVAGLKLTQQATGADRAIIALKKKYTKAVEKLRKASADSDVELYLMDNYYPAGDEVEMVHAVTGKAVPEGGLPLDVGIVVSNVNTLLNVREAHENGRAETTRWITVAGELAEPFIAEVPIGTTVDRLLGLGKPLIDDPALMVGGPMTGNLVDREHGVSKTCGALIVLPPDNTTAVRKRRTPATEYRRGQSMCDQCFECTIVCPRNLIGHTLYPDKIMRNLFIAPEESKCDLTSVYLCCECGLCDMYACPMDLSPRDVIVQIRSELQAAGIENPHNNSELTCHPEKEYRRVNTDRMIARLGLSKYDLHEFPLKQVETDRVIISLTQHVGAPSTPVVKAGERVERGQLIADIPTGALSSKVHASISGTVTNINNQKIEITAEAN